MTGPKHKRFRKSSISTSQWWLGAGHSPYGTSRDAELLEEVWMEVPKAALAGNPELADSYAYVSRALYGLGHAPRAWSQHLDKWFRTN